MHPFEVGARAVTTAKVNDSTAAEADGCPPGRRLNTSDNLTTPGNDIIISGRYLAVLALSCVSKGCHLRRPLPNRE
jgi:hypothetical protein